MLGIDIVDIEQVKRIYQRHGSLFLEKILGNEEIKQLPDQENPNFFKRLSCLIACKEAIFKAASKADLGWRDILVHDLTKNPLIYIKKADFSQKIKLSFAIDQNLVVSQAFII